MSIFPLLVIVHALAATVWTGGHLLLDLGVLPRALRAQSAAQVRAFEEVFEPLGLTALAIQVLTGLGMGYSARSTLSACCGNRHRSSPGQWELMKGASWQPLHSRSTSSNSTARRTTS